MKNTEKHPLDDWVWAIGWGVILIIGTILLAINFDRFSDKDLEQNYAYVENMIVTDKRYYTDGYSYNRAGGEGNSVMYVEFEWEDRVVKAKYPFSDDIEEGDIVEGYIEKADPRYVYTDYDITEMFIIKVILIIWNIVCIAGLIYCIVANVSKKKNSQEVLSDE